MHRRALLARTAAIGGFGAVSSCLGQASRAVASDPPGFERRWQSPVDGSVVAARGGRVFGTHRRVFAVDTETGDLEWRYGSSGVYSVYRSLVVDDALYFRRIIDAGPGKLYAVEFDGTERWTAEVANVHPRPAIVDGVVYVGRNDGVVRALETATGERRWRTEFDGGAAVYAVDDAVYAIIGYYPSGEIVALDRADGSVLWRYSVPIDSFYPETLTVLDGTVYLSSGGGPVIAVADGTELWRATEIAGIRAVDTDRLFVQNTDETLRALEASTGMELWTNDTFERDIDVAVHDGMVYVAGDRLRAFRTVDGAEAWSREVESESPIRSLSLTDTSPAKTYFGLGSNYQLHVTTDHRFAQYDLEGTETWATTFEAELGGQLFDELLFLETSAGLSALEPIYPDE